MDLGPVAVAVLSKEASPGRVKTRLCPPLSPIQASRVYSAMLRCWLAKLAGLQPAGLVLCVDPPDAVERMRRGLAVAVSDVRPQPAGDLGQRIAAAARSARMYAERVLVTGVDSPDVPRLAIQRAASLTAAADVVLCPTDDGGFWAIGVRGEAPLDPLLAGIDWSSGKELAQTRDRATRLGLSVAAGPSWRDVDRPDDLDAMMCRLKGSNDPADRALELELAFLAESLQS